MMDEQKVRELVKEEIEKIFHQSQAVPGSIKARHIDSAETGLYFETSSGVKRIGIGGTGQYFYKGNTGEIRLFSTLTTDGDIITTGATTNSIRIYRSDGKFVFGDGAGGYDVNLYRGSANELRTDDQLTVGLDIIAVGDVRVYSATDGLTLKDRVTATEYRLKVTSGTLGLEAY
jgi:hypothetical protein